MESIDIGGFIAQALASASFWLPFALLASIIIVQFFKLVVKAVLKGKYRQYYSILFMLIAYLSGFGCGMFFLEGADVLKWALLTGLVNPTVYFGLEQWAKARNKLVLLSILKMRPLTRDSEGNVSLDDTQVFMVKKNEK